MAFSTQGAAIKWLALGLLLAQNSMTPIVSRFATTSNASAERYSLPTSVLCSEVLKLALSLLLLFWEKGLGGMVEALNRDIIGSPSDTAKLIVPAALYFLQNNLLQLAAANLPAAVFQVTYQGKTLVVAFMSVVLLKKVLVRSRWLALALMGVGLTAVQLAKNTESKQAEMANAAEQNWSTGMLCVLMGCFCSGFAGVYFEKMMKSPSTAAAKKPSMWVRNVQLASFSILFGLVPLLTSADGIGHPAGMFRGFTAPVWGMVVNSAVGGLLVALVIKVADNLLKGFACALATVVTCIVSVPLFGFSLNAQFCLGTVVVVAATLLYGGLVTLDGDWWASEPDMCLALRGGGGAAGSGSCGGDGGTRDVEKGCELGAVGLKGKLLQGPDPEANLAATPAPDEWKGDAR